MNVDTYKYSTLTASVVSYLPGETHFIEAAEIPCLGVFFLKGSWRLHTSGVESGMEDLGLHTPIDGVWPRRFWNEYSETDYCEGGPDGVTWICIESDTPYTLANSQAPLTLPANTGMLVLTGVVTIGDGDSPEQVTPKEIVHDNKTFRIYINPVEIAEGTGYEMAFFPATSTDRDVTGNGLVLLIGS